MRGFWLATVAGVLLATPALGADLPARRAPVYAPPPPVPAFSWTGFYLGGQVGYQFGRSAATTVFTPTGTFIDGNSASENGVIGGGHVGYLFSTQSLPVLGSLFGASGGFGTGGVVGIEGDVDGSSAKATYPILAGFDTDTARQDIQGSVRGRLGIAFDRVLFYATGGAAFGSLSNTYVGVAGTVDNSSRTRVGYTVGGGVEYAFTNNLSARVEYRFTDYGTFANALTNTGAGLFVANERETNNRVQAGFSYKFDTAVPAPVVARY